MPGLGVTHRPGGTGSCGAGLFTAAQTAPTHLAVPRLWWEWRLSCVVLRAAAPEVQCQGGDRNLQCQGGMPSSAMSRGAMLTAVAAAVHRHHRRRCRQCSANPRARTAVTAGVPPVSPPLATSSTQGRDPTPSVGWRPSATWIASSSRSGRVGPHCCCRRVTHCPPPPSHQG